MGHQIEYIAAIPKSRVQRWLATLSGFTLSGFAPMSGWEGNLASGGTFWAYSIDQATTFVLCAKYTWLFNGDLATVEFARRFEAEFWRHNGAVPLLRLDELLHSEWVAETGEEWWAFSIDVALPWLADKEQTHWKLLSPPGFPE